MVLIIFIDNIFLTGFMNDVRRSTLTPSPENQNKSTRRKFKNVSETGYISSTQRESDRFNSLSYNFQGSLSLSLSKFRRSCSRKDNARMLQYETISSSGT